MDPGFDMPKSSSAGAGLLQHRTQSGAADRELFRETRFSLRLWTS